MQDWPGWTSCAGMRFMKGHDLQSQVEAYRERTGYYPESVLGDPIYGTRDNRRDGSRSLAYALRVNRWGGRGKSMKQTVRS